MPRLFVGLRIPDHIKQLLQRTQGGVTQARWQSSAQFHLTLRFIGDVDGATAADVETALERLSFAPFDMHCEGVGLFGKLNKARCLWAGAKPRTPLTALHNKVEQLLSSGVGIAQDRRQFEPHVTLARFSGRHGPLDSFFQAGGGFKTPSWKVDHVTLFLSTLGAEGAHYTPLADYGDGAPVHYGTEFEDFTV